MGDNSFEVEMRALVDEKFKETLIGADGTLGKNDPYQDEYYKPVGGSWDPEKITLRVRSAPNRPTADVIFSKVEYLEKKGFRIKRSLYPQGKIKLYSGSMQTARSLTRDFGFEPWFTVKKTFSAVCKLEGVEFALEEIEGFGWTLEIEGDGTDPEHALLDLVGKMKKLGITDKQLLPTSLPKAFAVKRGLV